MLRIIPVTTLLLGIVKLTILLTAMLCCASCGGSTTATKLQADTSSATPQRITAQWLETQPGQSIASVGFHLLDANSQAIADWHGLSVTQASGEKETSTPEFILQAANNAPADIYLFLNYDPESLALDTVELAQGRQAEYLLLTIAHRQPGVLIVALARTGMRDGTQLVAPGALASIRFQPGPERVFKSISLVNSDPDSAPVLGISEVDGKPLLSWTERNIGDYDNNSLVGAPDIAPIAMYYLELTADAAVPAQLELIDGDGNGEINSADMVPIARNFDTSINGYNVYRAIGSAPAEGDFSLLSGGAPTVSRTSVWEAATSTARSQALVYTYTPAVVEGENTFYVTAWANDGSTGLASNQVSYTASPDNLPPVWDTTLEITSTAPSANGLRLTFGSATDPEGEDVSYLLRHVKGSAADLSGANAESLVLTATELGVTPPFTYELVLTERSVSYTMTLQAQDEHGARTVITQYTHAFLPGLAVSSDPWGCFRADAARTGSNPAGGPLEPLAINWQATPGLSGASEPVISESAWVAMGLDSSIARYILSDGTDAGALTGDLTGAPYSLALDGSRMAASANSGAQLQWFGANPGAATLTFVTGQAPPLLLGEYIILAGADGVVRAYTTENYAIATLAWETELGDQPIDGGCLAPASDGTSVYIGLASGKLFKLDALTGEVTATREPSKSLVGDGVCLDVEAGRLFISLEDTLLSELETGGLAFEFNRLPNSGESSQGTPVLALHTDPPLALCPVASEDGGDQRGELLAINLDTWDDAWRYDAGLNVDVSRVGAGANRIYINTGSELLVLDYAGRLRQTVSGLPGAAGSGPAFNKDALVQVNEGTLSALTSTVDTPPEWVGATGIRSLTVLGSDLDIAWDYATEAQGEPVAYAIYYAANEPPMFEAPYTNTTVISGIPHTGTAHSYTLTDLDADVRYYVGVRAYDGYWDDNPTTEDNENYLAATPPWQREELLLGDSLDLPDGEVYFLRGLAAPDGDLHLIYSQREDASLTHAWGTVGSWQHEGSNLNAIIASTFDLGWTSDLVFAWGNSSQFGLLERTGADAWDLTVAPFSPLIPPVNPQLALILGPDPAIVFTEYVDGVFPEIDIDYYAQQSTGGTWDAAYSMDALNYSGRDLDLVLNPADTAQLWASYQRGGNNTPERATPMAGECAYAWGDGAGGFTIDVLDNGDNSPASDCGKRVQQVLDSSGNPWLAYFDLNSSDSMPLGQLKCAYWSGSVWSIETVTTFDLSFQTGSNQFTYGELGFALDGSGRPVITYLARQTWASQVNLPHVVRCYTWIRELDGTWREVQLTDGEAVFPRDREPCVLLIAPDASWHVFYASTQFPDDPDTVADKIVHLWRPAP